MSFRLWAVMLCVLVTACTSKDTPPVTNTAGASPAVTTSTATPGAVANNPAVKSKIDPCSLLTSDEIKALQGEAVLNALRSDRLDGHFIVAQCYYALPNTANSVVLNVSTAPDGSKSMTPRQYWEGTFAGAESEEKEGARAKERERREKEERERRDKAQNRERGEEEGEEGVKPLKVNGLGDEAFWIGSRVGGAIYVLKKDLFFRISVGGAGDEKSKLDKSTKLAQHVLKRL